MVLNLRSKLRNKILNFFFLNESRKEYVNELSRLLGADPKNVHRALVQLEAEGILKSEYSGEERYFSSNKKNPLYKNYKDLFLKIAGLETVLKNCLKTVTGLSQAYLFGSYARNKMDTQSDIDLLLVGEYRVMSVEKILHGVQKEISREINAIHLMLEDFERKKKTKDPFITDIFKNPVIRIL